MHVHDAQRGQPVHEVEDTTIVKFARVQDEFAEGDAPGD